MYFIYLVSRNTFSLSPLTDALLCWGWGVGGVGTSVVGLLNVSGPRVAVFLSFLLSFYVNVNKNAAAPSRAEQSMSNGMNGNVRYVF